MIDRLKTVPDKIVEDRLKTTLLKNLSQFTADSIIKLCDKLTKFDDSMTKLLHSDDNILAQHALLLALQLPLEYEQILKKFIELMTGQKNKAMRQDIANILSGFSPRALKLIIDPTATITVPRYRAPRETISFFEFIAEANQKSHPERHDEPLLRKMIPVLTNSHFLDLLDKKILLFAESNAVCNRLKLCNFLFNNKIEIDRKLMQAVLDNPNVDTYDTRAIQLAISDGKKYTTDSCCIFLELTSCGYFQNYGRQAAFTKKIIEAIEIPLLLQLKNTNLWRDFGIFVRKCAVSNTINNTFFTDLKQTVASFIRKEMTKKQFKESLENLLPTPILPSIPAPSPAQQNASPVTLPFLPLGYHIPAAAGIPASQQDSTQVSAAPLPSAPPPQTFTIPLGVLIPESQQASTQAAAVAPSPAGLMHSPSAPMMKPAAGLGSPAVGRRSLLKEIILLKPNQHPVLTLNSMPIAEENLTKIYEELHDLSLFVYQRLRKIRNLQPAVNAAGAVLAQANAACVAVAQQQSSSGASAGTPLPPVAPVSQPTNAEQLPAEQPPKGKKRPNEEVDVRRSPRNHPTPARLAQLNGIFIANSASSSNADPLAAVEQRLEKDTDDNPTPVKKGKQERRGPGQYNQ